MGLRATNLASDSQQHTQQCVGSNGTVFEAVGIFCAEGGETLAQVAQRGGRCPVPGNIQGQVGQGSEQPDLVEDVPAHCRGVGLDGLSCPFQPKLFYDSMIM